MRILGRMGIYHKFVAVGIGILLFSIARSSKLEIMLGRGHLSKMRKGQGSWPDRENLQGTPVAGREDMILMDGQLERDNLLGLCRKSRPQKYLSPPKRPWGVCAASQPKRLWDFSPPFCKERLQGFTRSIPRSQDPREYCCSSVEAVRSMGCIQLSSAHRSRVYLEESGDTAVRRSQCTTVPGAQIDQANERQDFWSTTNNALFMESAESQDHDQQSSFDHQANSFTKAVTKQQSKACQLNANVEFEIEEIDRLKAQMALRCEKLAWHISRCSKGTSKAGINSFDSEESLLLKGVEELKRMISEPKGSSEFQRGQEKAFEAACAGSQEIGDICLCRKLAWKSGIVTLFQAMFWCSGFMLTYVRSTRGGPELIPT